MRTVPSIIILMTFVSLVGFAWAQAQRGGGAAGPAMTLTTPAWPDGGQIPVKYTQAVPNPVSPELKWANAPQGTMSFVIHMHDPDAALNNTTNDQVHWLVWNIPASASGMPEGVPMGSQLADGSRQISASGATYR